MRSLFIIVSFFFSYQQAFPCSCPWIKTHLETISAFSSKFSNENLKYEPLIARGKILTHIEHSVDFEITEILSGKESKQVLRVWGAKQKADGSCGALLSEFADNSEWLFYLIPAEHGFGGSQEGDYRLLEMCGRFFLPIANENGVATINGAIAPNVDKLSYVAYKELLANTLAKLQVGIEKLQGFNVSCDVRGTLDYKYENYPIITPSTKVFPYSGRHHFFPVTLQDVSKYPVPVQEFFQALKPEIRLFVHSSPLDIQKSFLLQKTEYSFEFHTADHQYSHYTQLDTYVNLAETGSVLNQPTKQTLSVPITKNGNHFTFSGRFRCGPKAISASFY